MAQENMTGAELMKRINNKMFKQAAETLSAYNITFTQSRMLLTIYNTEKDAVPLKSLERYFEVAQSTAAGVIVRLEKRGLITSFISQEDRRLKMVSLTDEGKEICRCVKDNMANADNKLLAGLNDDEKCQLQMLLKKVYDSLK